MIKEYVLFGVWLSGLFVIIALVVICVAWMVKKDSMAYDRYMIWGNKPEADRNPPQD
ncbi:hypothetical protein AB6A23_10475 [Paenibacillus tarimensis]